MPNAKVPKRKKPFAAVLPDIVVLLRVTGNEQSAITGLEFAFADFEIFPALSARGRSVAAGRPDIEPSDEIPECRRYLDKSFL